MLRLFAKKEVLEWLKHGLKTIDVRKGKPREGDHVLFVSGPQRLEMRIVGRQMGSLLELIREDNFKLVVPSARSVEEARAYLGGFYGGYEGMFTAYFVEPVNAKSVNKDHIN